jgi:arginine/lysine/ornithine decarboxylase
MSGIILSGARPVYIYPKINRDFGIFYNISLQQIKEVTANHPKAKVVLVTNPTYYGVVCSLREITKFLLRQGKILLVDEAHGAHFGLVKCFPPSAMSVGATASVQSTHKVLGSLSQGSMLHLKGKGLSSARIREVLSLFQTTSPSYLILASLDVARHQIETPEGRKKLERVFSLSQKLRKALSNLSEFRVLEKLEEFELDVTKLTITSPFISGHELAERLATEFKIHVELATHSNILLLLTIGTTSSDIHRTISAFQRIARQLKGKKRRPKISSFTSPPLTHQVMSPREALLRRKKIVSLKEARDSISGEMLYLYPPGIPILNPGELITPEIQAYLQTNGRKPAFQSRITILEE